MGDIGGYPSPWTLTEPQRVVIDSRFVRPHPNVNFVELGEDPYHAEPPPVHEAPAPNFILMYLTHYLSNPWVLIIIAFLSYYYIFRRIWPWVVDKWEDMKMRREEEKEMAEMVRNPELYRKKMQAMDIARKRQQEMYEEAARAMAEREREKEEEKRRQRLEQLENLVSI